MIIDLTMPIHEGMQTFPSPNHPMVEITQLARHGIENRETRKLMLGTHTGTHIDAPRHFVPGGCTVDAINLSHINGRARLLNLSHMPPRARIESSHLEEIAQNNSLDRVLLRFDGCKRLGTMEYYTEQQWLTEGACRWLVSRGCRLLGLDVAMPDNPENGYGSLNDSPNHKILLGSGVVLVEYMVNLKSIPAPDFQLIVAPLKIRDGDGAPARCFAIT